MYVQFTSTGFCVVVLRVLCQSRKFFHDKWNQFYINPLIANPTKWSNTLNQFVGNLPTNCLSVFDHLVILALKGLNLIFRNIFKTSKCNIKKKLNKINSFCNYGNPVRFKNCIFIYPITPVKRKPASKFLYILIDNVLWKTERFCLYHCLVWRPVPNEVVRALVVVRNFPPK